MWTFISIFGLLAGIGALAWYYVATHGKEPAPQIPDSDPLRSLKPTPSMKATAKYFWVVTALFLVQIVLGGITAHYAVEGQGFYGFPLAEYLPYAVTRTWHLQLAVLWIATAWLATGLYIAPAISRPRAEVPAARRELPVHLPARHRRRRASPASGSR